MKLFLISIKQKQMMGKIMAKMNLIRMCLLFVVAMLILEALAQGNWAPSGIITESEQDGVASGMNVNQYMRLSRNSGYRFAAVPVFKETSSEKQFTLLAWFKLDKYPWDSSVGRDMDIIHIQARLRCMVTANKRIDCQAGRRYTEDSRTRGNVFHLDVSEDSLFLDQWYLLVCRSKNGQSRLSVYHQSFQRKRGNVFESGPVAEEGTGAFRPFEQGSGGNPDNQDVYIGVHRRQYQNGFEGSIRQVQVLKRHLDTEQQVKNAAFSYLLSPKDVFFQATLFNASKGVVDSVSLIRGSLVGRDARRGGITPVVDFKPQFWCWHVAEDQFLSWVKFDQTKDFKLRDYTMSSNVYSNRGQSGDYRTSFQAWIYRDPDESLPRQAETLFEQQDIWRLVFDSRSYDKVAIYNFQYLDLEVPFPRGRWVYVASYHDDDGFALHVEDEFGAVYSDGSQKRSYRSGADTKRTNNKIIFARYFSGYIQGIKYFKGIISNLRPYDFRATDETNGNILFYFRFNYDGLYDKKNGRSFKNYARGRTSSSYSVSVASGSASGALSRVPTKALGDVYKYSSIDYDIGWDGISCQDNEYRLFFEAGSSYAIAEFQFMKPREDDYTPNVGESYSDITVELWFRPAEYRRTSWRKNVLTLIKNGQPFFTIMETTKGELVCLPLYGDYEEDLRYGLQYLDYGINPADREVWHHVSCSVDSANERIVGTLLQQRNDGSRPEYGYLKETSGFDKKFRISQDRSWDKFQVQLNGDQGQRYGMQKTFYADVRLWKEPRSWHQIKDNRYMLLDYDAEQGKLISSVQYLGGGRSGSAEPDLAQVRYAYLNAIASWRGDEAVGSFVTFSGAQWKQDVDKSRRDYKRLVLCPQETYPNWQRTACSKQGLRDVQVLAMKDPERGVYEITAAHSVVQNERVHDEIDTLFSFKWDLGLVQPRGRQDYFQASLASFGPQARRPALAFKLTEVQDQAAYQFVLQVDDLKFKMLGSRRTDYWLQTSDCIQFFDKDSRNTTVTKTFSIEKGSENVYLNYVLEGCEGFGASQVDMSFRFLDEHHDMKTAYGYRYEIPFQRFLISKDEQKKLPINREVKLVLQARWNSRLTLSIVYKIMFITKVDVQLTPSYYIVPKGEDLRVYTSQTKVINHYGNAESLSYGLSWECPSLDLCQYGLKNFGRNSYLMIRSDDFLRSNLSHWQPHKITAISTSDFIQGDGSWTSRGSVEVVWIPFNPEVEIVGDDYVSIEQALTLEIVTKGVTLDEMLYTWTTKPKVDPKNYLNSNNRRHFVIKPNSLIQDVYYEVSVKIVLKKSGLAFWNGVKRVKINPTPQTGRVSVSPVQGEAFETMFKLEAEDWIVRHKPARYQFLYEDKNGQWSPLTDFQPERVIYMTLPPTIKVIVKLRDRLNAQVHGSSTVFCSLSDEEKAATALQAKFKQVMSEDSVVETLTTFSLNVHIFNELQQQASIDAAREQAKQIIEKLGEYQRTFDQATNEDEQEFRMASSMAIIAQLSRVPFVTELDQLATMQTIVKKYLEHTPEDGEKERKKEQLLVAFFKRDGQLCQQVMQTQENLVSKVQDLVERDEVPSLIYGFKNREVMAITEAMRENVVNLERLVGMSLEIGQKVEMGDKELDRINMVIQKFSQQEKPQNDTFKFKNADYQVPMATAVAPTEQQTYTKATFRANIFHGSNYVIPKKVRDPDTNETIVNMTQQEVFANQSLYVSWRDINGSYLDRDSLKGDIEYAIDYSFQKYKFKRNKEVPITHCVYMTPYFEKSQPEELDQQEDTSKTIEQQMKVKDQYSFGSEHCQTEIQYALNRVVCKCKHMSFFTVSRDEYYRPYDPVEGDFDFQNWPSFALFCYLMLVLIIGLIVTQNLDQRDIAKLNDMGDGDEFQVVSAEDDQISFPLQAYALKRQVQMMDYVDAEREGGQPISKSKLFWLSLTNFHHLLQFSHRFDPTFSRLDRFLVYFLQLSIVTFFSFLMLRNLDKADTTANQYDQALHGNQGSISSTGQGGDGGRLTEGNVAGDGSQVVSVLLCLAFFCLILHPLPNWCTLLLRRKYFLQESEDVDHADDADDVDNEPAAGAKSKDEQGSTTKVDESQASASHKTEGALTMANLLVDPDLPINLLFQISALPLDYLKKRKGGLRRFPFIEGTRADVGRALQLTAQSIQKKNKKKEKEEQERREQERLAKEKERRQRRRRRRAKEKRRARREEQAQGQAAGGPGATDKRRDREQRSEQVTGDERKGATRHAEPSSRDGGRLGSRSPLRQTHQLEGGEAEGEDSSSSIDLDDLEATQKDFVQDTSSKRQAHCRLVIVLLISALYICLLVIFSLEGMHNSKGHLLWVIAIIVAQALSLFLAEPLHFLAVSSIIANIEHRSTQQTAGNHDDSYKVDLAEFYYDYLVLVEDWKQVLRFQTQRI